MNYTTNIINCVTETDKLWGLITYDTFFTVIVTLSIFISGILLDRLAKYVDKRGKQKELRNYFKHFLDRIIDKTCPQLTAMYRRVYQQYGIDEGIPTAPPKILTGDFQRVRNIQDKKLFNAFNNKESLSAIFNYIDFLELIIGEIDDFHKRIRSDSDNLKIPLQEKINKYFDTLANYIEHVRKDDPKYDHLDTFRDLVNSSIKLDYDENGFKQQLTKVYKTIIRPIQKEVVSTNIFRIDDYAFKIAELGKDISIQYNYLRIMTIDFRLEYRKFSKYVLDIQNKLVDERKKTNWR